MRAAIWAESVKLMSSLAGRVATLAIVVGVVALSGAILAAVSAGNADVIAKLGPAAAADWNGYLLSTAQITAAGGLGGFGIVMAWMFGREFTEGTITSIFGLPMGRATISLAKFIAYALWAITVAILLTAGILAAGIALGLGELGIETAQALLRQTMLTVLTAALAMPIAWATTLFRSVLGGVGATAGLIVVGQFSVLMGAGAWMPLAAPALWAMSGGEGVTLLQLGMLVPYAALAILLTGVTWHRLQLDR